MSATILDLANARTQRAAAVAAARAASDAVELAVMHAVKQLVDKIAADKANRRSSTPEEYLKCLTTCLTRKGTK
jgi:hypothetical protein